MKLICELASKDELSAPFKLISKEALTYDGVAEAVGFVGCELIGALDGVLDGAFDGAFDGALVGALVSPTLEGALEGAFDGEFDGALVGALRSTFVGVCVGECVVHVLQSVQSVPASQLAGSSHIWSFAYWHVSAVIVGAQLAVGAQLTVGAALLPHAFAVVE